MLWSTDRLESFVCKRRDSTVDETDYEYLSYKEEQGLHQTMSELELTEFDGGLFLFYSGPLYSAENILAFLHKNYQAILDKKAKRKKTAKSTCNFFAVDVY